MVVRTLNRLPLYRRWLAKALSSCGYTTAEARLAEVRPRKHASASLLPAQPRTE